jgi:hypothetical protein
MTSNTEQELKRRCDAIGHQLLVLVEEQAGDLPATLCCSIIFRAASALAVALKVPKAIAVKVVLLAYDDLEANK